VVTPQRDLSLIRQRLEDKFRAITTPHLDLDRAEALIAALGAPVPEMDVRALIGLTRRMAAR
jgi:hypothetical protein